MTVQGKAGEYSSYSAMESIRNKSSSVAKKPPGDLDFGILAKSRDDLDELLRDIRKSGGNIDDFHKAIQKSLDDSFKEVARELDLPTANPKKAFIAGTTGFHPEAYKDFGILEGNAPARKWAYQAADVSAYKIHELRKLVDDGLISAQSAAQEAARGTLKDLDKVERTFALITDRTGKVPKLSKANIELRGLLEKLNDASNPKAINKAIAKIKNLKGHRDVFSACNRLIDNMETAWKFALKSDSEVFLERLLKGILVRQGLEPKDFNNAMQALDEGNFKKLPINMKKIRKDIFDMTAYKRVSLIDVSGQEIFTEFQKDLNIKGLDAKGKQTLGQLVDNLDQTNSVRVYKNILGQDLGQSFVKVKQYMPDEVKVSLAKRLSPRMSLKKLHGNLVSLQKKHISTEFGDSRIGLGVDAVIGIAMTFWEINNIMDEHHDPAEESRLLTNAVISNMPVAGDIFMAMNTGAEAYWEGSYSKAGMSAAYIVIGIGGMVPGFQLPALVAGLGMGGLSLGIVAWDISAQKDIIWAWVDSGNWNDYEPNGVFKSGKMIALIDAKGKEHRFGNKSTPKAEHEFLFAKFITQGDVFYHTPLRLADQRSVLPGKTIRDSVYDFSERTVLKKHQKFEILKTALSAQYPEFEVAKELRKPLNAGRSALLGHMQEKAPNNAARKLIHPKKTVAFKLYEELKLEYDLAAVEAIKMLRQEAEAEYQAFFYAGEAKATLEKVKQLGAEYRLPLSKHVDLIIDDNLRGLTEFIKSPWEKHSIPRRRIDLASEYVRAYDVDIRNAILRIEKAFKLADARPPSTINPYNLTGYMGLDLERIRNLESAYGSAPKKVKDDVGRITPVDVRSPCLNDLYKQLVSLRLRRTHAYDIQLLYEQWAGRRRAAQQERDVALQDIIDHANSTYTGVVTIPELLWKQAARKLGDLYAWEHLTVTWGDRLLAFDVERQYLEATEPIIKRITKLDQEYKDVLAKLSRLNVTACTSTVTVKLRTRATTDVKQQVIAGASVSLQGPFPGAKPLQEISPGNYQVDVPQTTGSLQIVISHSAYRGEDGSLKVNRKLVLEQPQTGKTPPPIIETVYLVPVPMQIILTVVDDLGNAVPGADVALLGSLWRSGEPRPVDRSGHITFEDVPPGTYQVDVQAPGYQPLVVPGQITVYAADVSANPSRHITLTPYLSTVKISVENTVTEPAKDVQVTLGNHVGTTDALGEITFSPVRPSGGLEPYKVLATKAGYAPIATTLEVSPSQKDEKFLLKMTLQGSLTLTVKVVEAVTGKELNKAAVQLSFKEEQMAATSNENGIVQFKGIAPAFVYISAALRGYQLVSVVDIDLRFATKGDKPTVVELSKGMKITAYVKDEKGELLASGYVSMDNGPYYEAPTGSKEFTPVKEGIHIFRGRAKKFAESSVVYAAKPEDKISDTVNLQLIPGATLMVEVRNERGDLLNGKPTQITLLNNSKPIETASGPLKLFVYLGPGTYSAKANAKGYKSGLSRKLHYSGDPPTFHDTLQVTLVSEIQLSTIRVAVDARDDKGNHVMRSARIKVTGPAGSYTDNDVIGNFPDLIPGKYTVTASVSGFTSKTKAVTIAADQPGKIYTLSFSLSAKDEPEKQTDKKKKELPTGLKVLDWSSCTNDCDTDECISSCILRKYKYCERVSLGGADNSSRNKVFDNCIQAR